jgi:RimJ/RimL family protein N-acetyltransferase
MSLAAGRRLLSYINPQADQMDAATIRTLDPAEWPVFRDFRLYALKTAPGVFGSCYEAEATRTAEEWQDGVRGPGHQVFGLFDGERMIGITAAFTWRDDPSGKTAVLAMSFMQPEYRGRGLSRLLYEARLDWIRAHPQFERVVVSHRESNEPSRRANQRHGFQPTGRKSKVWPDGTTEDEILYELRLTD